MSPALLSRRGFARDGPCLSHPSSFICESACGLPRGLQVAQVLRAAWVCEQLVVLDEELSSLDRRYRPAGELLALEGGEVGVRTELARVDHALEGRVDDGQVGVSADADRALLRIHPEDLRRALGDALRQALQRYATLMVAVVEHRRQVRADGGQADAGAVQSLLR